MKPDLCHQKVRRKTIENIVFMFSYFLLNVHSLYGFGLILMHLYLERLSYCRARLNAPKPTYYYVKGAVVTRFTEY